MFALFGFRFADFQSNRPRVRSADEIVKETSNRSQVNQQAPTGEFAAEVSYDIKNLFQHPFSPFQLDKAFVVYLSLLKTCKSILLVKFPYIPASSLCYRHPKYKFP